MPDRPKPGDVEERTAASAVDGKRVHGLVPYGVKANLGDFTEEIQPGALRDTKLDALVAVIDHEDRGLPLARYPRSLRTEHRNDGLAWSFEPPTSRQDVIEAISRGDIAGSSWRMRVGAEKWDGDHRTITRIDELRDITLAGSQQPVYATTVEYRTHNPATGQEDTMADEATSTPTTAPQGAPNATNDPAPTQAPDEVRTSSGGLDVESRASGTATRGLADEFRSRGFPGEIATMEWPDYESRALTWTGSVDNVAPVRREGVPFGYDQRFAFPAFQSIGVDEGATSVAVLQQTARTLATPTNTVRAIDATSSKPETASTVTLTSIPLKQVANIVSGIPNVMLETPAITSVIENDLRLALAGGLDKLVLDAIATAGFTAPGTDPLLISIRKAVTTLRAAGYNPNLLVLTPANDEALDVLVSGIASGVNDYVFEPGAFSPGTIFGMQRRVSKTIPAPAVVDTAAFGKLYASRVSLARFEESAGATNSSLLRLETHAAFGLERVTAASRIAAS